MGSSFPSSILVWILLVRLVVASRKRIIFAHLRFFVNLSKKREKTKARAMPVHRPLSIRDRR